MRVVVIGGTGHIGSYLVPRLATAGHTVVSVSRGRREPYHPHGAWGKVERVVLDRDQAEADGTFGRRIAGLEGDVVVDLTCFTLDSARHLVEALRGRVHHFLHCGTLWVHGPGVEVPTTEEQERRPFDEYGKAKAAIEAYLLSEARRGHFPATVLHPGHIVGPGWPAVNPQGNFNPQVFATLARGGPLKIPNLGLETVHHVHADDVAQAFTRAMARWSVSTGEAFHVVSPAALTLRGYAESMAVWFQQEASIELVPWEVFKRSVSEEDAAATWSHIAHSPNASIAKARELLGYQPRYRSLEAVQEAVSWQLAHA
ncbi:MAG: NAD-dependent epimerase/dehydratase family protein [Candidatus Dormibacteraeota bacterium]|nr:NAD-dependent epimerase/dehydratase family protein [Candidatus Dormibacteraeota bacterium]